MTAFEKWWLSQPDDVRRAYPPGGVEIARDGFRVGVMAGTAKMAEQLKDSGTADFVTSTRDGVVRTEPGRCEPNMRYALIPMPPNG